MKILLVQVPTSHLGAREKVYPLGLSRLSSIIPGHIEKIGLDMNVVAEPWLELKTLLEKTCPDVVAFSFRNIDPLAGHHASYVPSLSTAAQMVRTLVPGARILAGGPAFSLFAHSLMEKIVQIDYGIRGEGEKSFLRLLEEKIQPRTIPGLIWRRNGKIFLNAAASPILMDEIPSMDLSVFPAQNYAKDNLYVAAMGIEGKRGCDLWCSYCLYPFLGGTAMRLRNPSRIADEMEMLSKDEGIGLFHFTDPVVNRPADHFEQVCRQIIKRKICVSWTGFFREDDVTHDSLALAKEAGLAAVYFSGDALTQKGLTQLNKKLTPQDLLNASKITTDLNLLTMCHFLVNLPGDEDEDIAASRQMLERLLEIHHNRGNLGAMIFNNIRLYPDAPLTRMLIKKGLLSPATNFLYPVYHNPEKYRHILYEFEERCQLAGVFSRLEIPI